MVSYYNPGLWANPSVGSAYHTPYVPQPVSYTMPVYNTSNNYWISVDGEMAARAWQMPANLPPNTIIPLWDINGQYVYFKSTDAYGRINPLRKGRVVFDDEPQMLPDGESGASVNAPSGTNYVGESMAQDMSKYVTKDEINGLRNEIQEMLKFQKESIQQQKDTIAQTQKDFAANTNEFNSSMATGNSNQNGKNFSWKNRGDSK